LIFFVEKFFEIIELLTFIELPKLSLLVTVLFKSLSSVLFLANGVLLKAKN